MEAVKNTVNQASESVQGAMSGASKQGNEEIAKGHTNAGATTRLTAAKDAVSDKVDEKKHDTKSDVYANK
ncbi:Glucose-repressible protein [Imshaugia aleurites]|uniref:Glucose-repressible protein n=1 Tax=Imshaugia aleurites TaxID=172621 RepID=A0A8H3FWZ3_9LECA|nr:Glucose-repressible protein [Imshaugia aleurites]